MTKGTSIEQEIAPHVDPVWAEAMLLELRILGVSGDQIGAALGEVESHVVESGESAADAFGDPAQYARSLGLTPSPEHSRKQILIAIATTPVELLGMAGTVAGAAALRHSGSVAVSWGVLFTTVVFVGIIIVLGFAMDRALRFLLASPVRAAVIVGITSQFIALPWLLLPDAAFMLPAGLSVVLGLALLVAGTVVSFRLARTEDRVTAPLATEGTSAECTRWLRLAAMLGVPVATVLLTGLAILL